MAKPAIALSAPPVLYAGGDHQVEIEITPEEALKVDYVEARVMGRQGWEVGSGKSRVTHRVVYPTLVTRFMDQGVLPAGRQQFAMRFQLPLDLPPSHSIDPGRPERPRNPVLPVCRQCSQLRSPKANAPNRSQPKIAMDVMGRLCE